MKKYFLCFLMLLIFLCACSSVKWVFVEESILEKAEYTEGSFSVGAKWTLTFKSGTVLVQNAIKNQAFFIGRTYEIYYKGETFSHFPRYKAVLK